MSEKAKDHHGRWRNKTIGVRVSPEEDAMINQKAALSGMTKQEYAVSSMLHHEVTVLGSPRIHKALREYMIRLCEEFERLATIHDLSPEELETVRYLAKIYDGLRNEMEKPK